jgi:hypothetical protein
MKRGYELATTMDLTSSAVERGFIPRQGEAAYKMPPYVLFITPLAPLTLKAV